MLEALLDGHPFLDDEAGSVSVVLITVELLKENTWVFCDVLGISSVKRVVFLLRRRSVSPRWDVIGTEPIPFD